MSLKGQSGEESKIWLVAGCVGGLLGGRRVGIIRHGGKFGLRTWRHCGDKIFTDDVSGPRGNCRVSPAGISSSFLALSF